MKIFKSLDYNERKILKSLFFLLLYIICTIGYTFFVFRSNAIQGEDDLTFHLSRALGLESIFQSPINFKTFNSGGYPINLFYGWITLYPMYFLIKISGSIVLGYNIYFALLTFLTFLICHFSFHKIFDSSFGSCIFSLCYTLSGYRALDIYSRAAVGESIALTVLPLVFCSFYLLLIKKSHSWKLLAISMSLLLYSHALSPFLASIYFLFIFICFIGYKIIYISKETNKNGLLRIFINLFKAIILTLLLTCFFYLPMLEQFKFQPLTIPYITLLDEHALTFGTQLIGGALNNDYQAHSIGVVLLICFIILCFRIEKLDFLAKVSFALACFSLFMSTNLFPWSILQKNLINIIQFPWRINGFATLFIAVAFSIFIGRHSGKYSSSRKIFMAIFIGFFLCALNYASVINFRRDSNTLPISEELAMKNVSCHVHPDYLPKNLQSKKQMIQEKKILFDGKELKYDEKVSSSKIQYEINAPKEGTIEVPIYKYKGYKIIVDGHRVPLNDSDLPIINFKVSSGKHHIDVSYEYTKLAKKSVLVSMLGILVLLVASIYNFVIKFPGKSI